MSYCVKCGVELSPAEKKCPLCFTVVNNQEDIHTKAASPYPSEMDEIKHNGKSIAILGLLILFIPAGICLLCNLLKSGSVDWSLYIIGGEACFFIYALLPLAFQKPRASVCVSADVAVTCVYLWVIGGLINNISWLLPLGIPITVLSGILIFTLIKIRNLKQLEDLHKLAAATVIIGLFVTLIESVINLFIHGRIILRWSLYILLPFSIIAVIFIFIESNHTLKDKIIRKLFI